MEINASTALPHLSAWMLPNVEDFWLKSAESGVHFKRAGPVRKHRARH
jgi:hypothetical protein